jgi:exodeoxyribonuclease VII large subunit
LNKNIILVKRHQLNLSAEKLAMLNPLGVLARGYGIIRSQDGQIIKNVVEVRPGQQLEVRLHDGSLTTQVIAVKEDN